MFLLERVQRLTPGAPILPTHIMNVLTTVAQSFVKQRERMELSLHSLFCPTVLPLPVVHTILTISLLLFLLFASTLWKA
jgi:hypothetical protein